MKIHSNQYIFLKFLPLLFVIFFASANSKDNNQINFIDPDQHNKLSKLSIPLPRNTSLGGKEIYQKVEEVNNWLKQGNYRAIEEFFQKAVAEGTLTAAGGFYASTVLDRLFKDSDYSMKAFDPKSQTYLDLWIKKYPNSSIAYLTRSVFYFKYAWEVRGNRFIQKTPEEAKQEFIAKMVLCVNDIKKALSLDPENPLIIANLLAIGNSYNMERETFEAYFQKAISLIPYFPDAYMAKTIYLEPQWHGSEAELLAFVRKTVKSSPKGSALPLIVITAHQGLCSYSHLNKKDYYSRPEVWQEIQANYERLIRELPESGYYAFEYAQLARKIGREDIAQYNYNLAWQRESNHPVIYKTLKPLIR